MDIDQNIRGRVGAAATLTVVAAASALSLSACFSNSSGSPDASIDSGGVDSGMSPDVFHVSDAFTFPVNDAPVEQDARIDSTLPDAPSSDAPTGPDGAGTVTLTVLNYLGWCSVTVNGGAGSTNGTITAYVDPGTVTIAATPASSMYAIGADPWFATSQDNGGAAPGTDNGDGSTETTTATVNVTGNQCVSVCCGDAPNGTGCPTMNPCLLIPADSGPADSEPAESGTPADSGTPTEAGTDACPITGGGSQSGVGCAAPCGGTCTTGTTSDFVTYTSTCGGQVFGLSCSGTCPSTCVCNGCTTPPETPACTASSCTAGSCGSIPCTCTTNGTQTGTTFVNYDVQPQLSALAAWNACMFPGTFTP
jgi:hypothetical protein